MNQLLLLEGIMYIESERIILKNITFSDVKALQKSANDAEIVEMMNGTIPYPYKEEDAQNWIHKHTKDEILSNNIALAIFEKFHNVFLGTVSLRQCEVAGTSRLSYWIGREFWNKGYATEAVKSIIGYIRQYNENISNIEAEVFENNLASKKVLKKLGFSNLGKRLEPRSMRVLYMYGLKLLKV